ncbi:hypothetical protein IZ6_08750 [Terrihabitans soli]|uniref:DUF3757 domain-containing protein n=1 Tax=Terrihabitans soli TaxID=708113 RepID=A0A6S6QT79_9HYPH|nr:hypothetical protein [Terrihabitans soli]BCJ90140.1 hypothetical protein IZ6_08750 [Terrihabitans soli]
MIRIAAVLAFSLATGAAFAADTPYSPEARGTTVVDDGVRLPLCNSRGVFGSIAAAFHDKESEYWDSDLRLESFDEPIEVGYRPWGTEFFARRFCVVRAQVSDGVVREVHYAIIHKAGTLGIAHRVEWCVNGLDRNLAFAPGCKMAGP